MSDSILHPNPQRLQDLAGGNLDQADRVVIESHVLTCATCQHEVTEWRSLFTTLATLPQFSPSIHFSDNVMAAVQLPDPWYVRGFARAMDRLHVYAPKTTRGWALASACMALPFALIAVVATWIVSKPYITPSNVFAFVLHRAELLLSSIAQGATSQVLQTDVALFAARQLEALSTAGMGAAGALLAAVSIATAGSAYILYQNLFRARAHRNHNYASYSF
jgi:anti-sigma factor RsiW